MGRNKPAVSVINAYSRLTFLRRMHPAIRAVYMTRLNTATFRGALGQFLRPYTTYEDAGNFLSLHILKKSTFQIVHCSS
jgi:hypothetical protein